MYRRSSTSVRREDDDRALDAARQGLHRSRGADDATRRSAHPTDERTAASHRVPLAAERGARPHRPPDAHATQRSERRRRRALTYTPVAGSCTAKSRSSLPATRNRSFKKEASPRGNWRACCTCGRHGSHDSARQLLRHGQQRLLLYIDGQENQQRRRRRKAKNDGLARATDQSGEHAIG